ncbi:MAG: GNAT family N-acetyltransferase [Candidatus Omnitrophica bacterium]|nr:GNAT family N-acetyltransferase [Candidatus Omnitrophota bacterium]
MIDKFPKHIIEPPNLAETKDFLVKLAENHEEIERAQRLRYEVFNLEQKRGLKHTDKYGIDFDEFDEYCLHLIAIDKQSGNVVGTYRAHLGCVANSAKGFYSSQEYEIHGLYDLAEKCLEMGRTCVDPGYRSGSIIALMWRAITELLYRSDLRYLLGCVSLEEMDPARGWALHEYLTEKGLIFKEFTVIPRPGFKLQKPPREEIDRILSDRTSLERSLPPLFKGYLNLGALICGEPALDGDFGTIDFFILLDTERIPERYKHHFNFRKKTG